MKTIDFDDDFNAVQSIDDLFGEPVDSVYTHRKAYSHSCKMPHLFDHNSITETHPKRDSKISRKSPFGWWNEVVEVPDLQIFSLRKAQVFGGKISIRHPYGWHGRGQLTLREDMSLFSCSGGIMDGMHSLPLDLLEKMNDGRYRLLRDDAPSFLPGISYLIGSIHPHFGHFMLEGLSRLWAASLIPASVRERANFIVYESGLSPYASSILELFGIKRHQIVFCPPRLVTEHLIVASPSYRTHWWAQKEHIETLQHIASSIPPADASHFPDRVFLTRRNVPRRALENILDVEDVFERSGYKIIDPERFNIIDQIRMLSSCKAIAGCVGSALYLAGFQKKSDIAQVVVAPRNFFLKDDAIICDSMKNGLNVALGSDISESTEMSWCANPRTVTAALEMALGSHY